MTARFVVTGTDTGVGKTVFAAALTDALGAYYWKPIQTGEEKDSETVRQLARLSPDRILPEACYFPLPASPHLAAATAGVTLRPWALSLPENRPLVIEGAGGLLVPLTRDCVFADVFARWQIPIILCARTTLGTINHTLLSLEAAKRRQIPVLGVAFIGEAQADTQEIIAEMGAVLVLGRLPNLDGITPDSLRCAFHSHFDLSHFQSGVDSLTEGG